MSRTVHRLTSVLLALLLAAVALPVAVHVLPDIFGRAKPKPSSQLPAAQQLPSTLAGVSGVTPLTPSAPLPRPTALAPLLTSALAAGTGVFTAYVADAATGAVLYDRGGSTPGMPASNLKLTTAVASLKTLGAGHRFSTTVLNAGDNKLVLKAGGDVLLAPGAGDASAVMGHAGLEDLARNTAAALARQHLSGPVTISVDDTLFPGPAVNPDWLPGDLAAGQIAPVYPMALYGARFDPAVSVGARPQDSALAVGVAFVQALRHDGVQVAGAVKRSTAGPGATPLATVSSATVAEQVQYMLQESDNYVAEALARLTAVGLHRNASPEGASAAVLSVLGQLGLPLQGLVMGDASGLAPSDRISPRQLTGLIRIVLTSPVTDLRQVLPGLPIAGLSGTLADRYSSATTITGAGVVRAKTGTLNEALTLSGYTVDHDGRLLVFSFIGNELTSGSAKAKPVIDRAAALLASCGCR